jgi:hypothetical protein
LTVEDTIHAAIRMYLRYRRPQEHIAKTLHVRTEQVNAWLSRTLKEQRDRENAQIMDLWFACYTGAEIGERLELNRTTIEMRMEELTNSYRDKNLSKLTFQDDFAAPLYNVWKQQEKSNKVKHFGNSEARWLDHLLYLYTAPFDIVVDPFAGGGATIESKF